MSSVASQLSGSPAGLWNPVRTGVATIPNGAKRVSVNDTKVTASSVILASANGANASTANAFSCASLTAGASFELGCDADPGAGGVVVRYWILKY